MSDLLLLIVSSPSGAGKTTLTRKLLHADPSFMFSVSHTTRRPRSGEVDGQDYHFTDKRTFKKMIGDGAFAEWAEVHGNFYGTSLSELERAQNDGKTVIVFDVDYQGARQIKAKLPNAVGVFILPPSMEALNERLHTRGTDSEEVIASRFEKARQQIEHYLFFDYLIVNDQVEEAAARMHGIVYAERSRRALHAQAAESLLQTGSVAPLE